MEFMILDVNGMANELKLRGEEYTKKTVMECAEAVNKGKLGTDLFTVLLLAVNIAGFPDHKIREWLGLEDIDLGLFVDEALGS